jgi:hypothetical protein
MPFKFWKKDKKEKPESEKPSEEEPPKKEAKPSPQQPPATTESASGSGAKAVTVVAPPKAADADATIQQVHGGLVDLGLTIAGTKPVFLKRLAGYAGGQNGFLEDFRKEPYRAVTRVLTDWLGFRAPGEFDPVKLLDEVNLRLSSFKLSVQMTDMTWLDKDLGLRKARLRVAETDRVVRFKDARDFVKGLNELLAPKKISFLELETWSEDYAFLLVREPKWDKLAASDLVIVKAPQTAMGGECGECGAPVGQYWHDCLSCGAVFGAA